MRLTATTYNIKFPDRNAPHPWEKRRPVMARQLARLAPGLLCVQEAYYSQMRDLAEDSAGRLDWVGLGREGGSRGEFCGVLYDRDLLDPVEYDHFWLSDTPDRVGSKTPSWGNFGNCRIATWVRFRTAAGELGVLNTHLDESSERARRWGAELIADRLGRAFGPDLPVLVFGDFNTGPGSETHRTLLRRAALADAWDTAPEAGPQVGSYAGWGEPVPGGERIDWILHRGPVEVTRATLDIVTEDGIHPSDHLPLTVELTI